MTPPRTKAGLTSTAPIAPHQPSPSTMEYLTALYGAAPQGCYIELRPFQPAWAGRDASRAAAARCWRPASEPASLSYYASQACADGMDVYVGVALRRARGGTSADVVAATCLWAELDGSPSKKGHGCQTKEEALARLMACRIAPSIIVDSGGGYHAYWLLTEPVTGGELRGLPMWNARVREMLRGADGGYAGDDVGDLARILRLPGTANYKQRDTPRQVALVECDPECRYSLEYLDTQLPALPEAAFRPAASPTDPAAPMQADPRRRAALVADAGAAWGLAEGHRHFLPHPMARVLLQAGWPWEDIPDLVADIASAGGSPDAALRRASAIKELGQPDEHQPRVGWPWLRQHAPEMAEALSQYTTPDTDDIKALAGHVAALVGTPPPPPPPAALADPVPGAIESTPTVEITPMPAATIKPKEVRLSAIAGGGDEPVEGRASERVYNLLRDRLAWIGRGREDARPYGGRKRSDGHHEWVETIALDGREAELWALEVVRSAGMALTETHRKIALDLLAAEARHQDVDLRLRYAPSAAGDAWLVDLGGEDWQVARIEKGRWSVERSIDAVFLRTACTMPYTAPDPKAKPQDLADGLQALLGCDEEITAQLACWMVQALQPAAPRMGLLVTGPQGSGKSTFARLARRIVDPATPPLMKFTLAKGREVDYQLANVHKAMLACVAYSNVSSLNEAASDFLCGLITGDGHIARALYSNVDPVLSEGRRTLVMEGISIIGMGADLQDRLLHLSLPMRLAFEPEAAFEARSAQWMPRIIGGLFAAAAKALEALPDIEEEHAHLLNQCRMRDAAAIYGAAAHALGYEPQTVLQKLVRSRSDLQATEAETDIVGQAILSWARLVRTTSGGSELFDGTLEAFEAAIQGGNRPHDLWPKTLRGFRSKLDRLVPGLRAKGLKIEMYRSRGTDRKACLTVETVSSQEEWQEDARIKRREPEPEPEVVPEPPPKITDLDKVADAYITAHKAFSFAMLPVLMAQRIAGFEGWAGPMRDVALSSDAARKALADSLTRRYPSSIIDGQTWWEGQYGAAQTWAAWLKTVA